MLKKGLLIAMVGLMASSVLAAPGGRSGSFGEANLTATLYVSQPINVKAIKNLEFGEVVSGAATDVVVAAADANAAQFSATGEAGSEVVAGMVSKSISLTNTKSNDKITVDSWTYAGDIQGRNIATFDKAGELKDLRVGGTAHVTANASGGSYTGTGKFRLTYV